jgi:hypothetical protein
MNVTRIALAVAIAVSGLSHAYLYVHGYQHIPLIGTAFLVQAGISFALALLILIGGPSWLRWVAAALSGGALVAFGLSRTVGLFGFSERGWQPSPHAAISVVAELVAVGLWAAYVLGRRQQASLRLRARHAFRTATAAPRTPRT